MAFEGLTEKLSNAFKKLRGKGRLSEADVKESMREIRLALLEADVNYKVVKDFIKKTTERCVGTDVQERQKKDRRQQNQKDQDTPPARFFRFHQPTPNKSVVFHTVPPFASSCQAKGAGFYSELPNLTENPPLRGPDELNRQYAYFIAAYALRFRPQSARLHCFRYSSLVIIMWRKPSSTPNSRKPALRWVSHAAISFRVTAKSLWILEMLQSRNA